VDIGPHLPEVARLARTGAGRAAGAACAQCEEDAVRGALFTNHSASNKLAVSRIPCVTLKLAASYAGAGRGT
jgi:hypothetical protein